MTISLPKYAQRIKAKHQMVEHAMRDGLEQALRNGLDKALGKCLDLAAQIGFTLGIAKQTFSSSQSDQWAAWLEHNVGLSEGTAEAYLLVTSQWHKSPEEAKHLYLRWRQAAAPHGLASGHDRNWFQKKLLDRPAK